jgi:transcriptional regulator with XRE-family HTH domain
MRVPVHSVHDVGVAVRVVRKASGVRQDDAAGSAGVSHVFLRDLEHGKQTVQFGRVLQVLDELGIRMELEIPDDAKERWQCRCQPCLSSRSGAWQIMRQTVQFGRVLQVLDELGIRMELEIPDDAKERWHQLVSQANSQSDAVLSSGSAT